MKKYAWYFPNWHVTPKNEELHGKGWTEWDVVKYARQRYEGQVQPKVPLWGYEDESDPKVMAKKIKAAKDHGIDGFVFDYYWFKDWGPYRIDCLDKGFLGAENNEDFEFGVMWCNHDPIYAHPAGYKVDNMKLTSGDCDVQLFYEITDYCIKNYFPKKNYVRVDGKVYFGIWDITRIISNFGGFEGARIVLDDFRRRAKEAGFDVYLTSHHATFQPYRDLASTKDITPEQIEQYKAEHKLWNDKLGLDSNFNYGWFFPPIDDDKWPIGEYSEMRKFNKQKYVTNTEFMSRPYDLAVATGWDSSARCCPSDNYGRVGYPYCPIILNNTPEEFELACREMKEFLESGKSTANIMYVSCWNEWTEGMYLEPDEQYGYGFLEAFKRVFGNNG